MFGQLGFFYKFKGKEIEDKRPLERYRAESERLLGVLDERLNGRQYIMDDEYTIADMALVGWVRAITAVYDARDVVHFDRFKHVELWLARLMTRPAVRLGLEIPRAVDVKPTNADDEKKTM